MNRAGIPLALALGLAAIAGFAAPAAAQGAADAESAALLLRPGEFLWYEHMLPASYGVAGDVSVVVSISGQRAYVYRGDALIGVSTVSTGKPGKANPVDRTQRRRRLLGLDRLATHPSPPGWAGSGSGTSITVRSISARSVSRPM